MRLVSIRSFKGAEIQFDFPVTALVGPNGGGKTTVLGAAALIYKDARRKDIQPKRFFAKSGRYDTSMQNWQVEYDLIAGSDKTSVRRTASYLKSKWNRDAVERDVRLFGVIRTVPANERKELSRCISGAFAGFGETQFSDDIVREVERILGKEASSYLRVNADQNGKIALFAAREPNGQDYSEFHFGAGEASVIRIISEIEQAPADALILIEEIENGLHPVATRALVEYLIRVAERKSCQVIFTTHSNDALAPLPSLAVWSCHGGKLSQGKLDVGALRTLTGRVEAQLAVFTEDQFGEEMARASLREFARESRLDLAGIKFHALGGAGNARKHALSHNSNPTISFPAICVLDGDKKGESDPSNNIVAFPGSGDPESHVFEQVFSRLDQVAARLCVAMNLHTTDQQRLREAVRHRRMTNYDPHIIFAQIGEDMDFTSEITVQRAFIAAWAQEFPGEVEELWKQVRTSLPIS